MAIDQRDVSSALRFMDDRALQQYAAMHKNDPYIFPLAFQESQNRQKIRMSQQTAQGMQPQPKVADQALAQMAPQPMPEEQGIGALPVDNMETMADGGIAGYPDDDFVTRNQSVVMMAEGGQVPRYNGTQGSVTNSMPQFIQDIMGIPQMYTDYQQRIREEDERKAESDRRMAQRRQEQLAARQKTSFANYLFGSPEREAEGKAQLADLSATATPKPLTVTQKQDIAARDRDSLSEQQAAAVVSAAQPTPAPRAPAPAAGPARKDAPTSKRGPASSTAAGPASAGPAPSNQFDVDTMMSTALAKQRAAPDPLDKDRETVGAEKEALARENVAGIQAIQKRFDNIFAGKKERLATREGEIAKMKDQSLGLALLNAGAAMMSTRGNIGQALGAGIDTGSKQYVAGLDKINSAKEKLSDARDRLDELESQRGELSARELHKANQEVRQAGISVKEDMIKARMAFNNETYAKAEKAVTNQLNANLEVYKQQQANVRTDKTVAGAIEARRGDPANKQLELQIKVQNLLQNNPEYKAAALRAGFKGTMGETARAAMKNIERDTYAKFAPELLQLQSNPASPAGAGSGLDLSQWGKSQVVNE